MRTAKALCSLAGSGGVINRRGRQKGAKMKTRAISVNSMTIRDKRSGQPITLCQVFVADGSGRIGSLYTRKPIKAGEEVEIGFQAERDGKIKSRII